MRWHATHQFLKTYTLVSVVEACTGYISYSDRDYKYRVCAWRNALWLHHWLNPRIIAILHSWNKIINSIQIIHPPIHPSLYNPQTRILLTITQKFRPSKPSSDSLSGRNLEVIVNKILGKNNKVFVLYKLIE